MIRLNEWYHTIDENGWESLFSWALRFFPSLYFILEQFVKSMQFINNLQGYTKEGYVLIILLNVIIEKLIFNTLYFRCESLSVHSLVLINAVWIFWSNKCYSRLFKFLLIEKSVYRTNGLSTDMHKRILIHCGQRAKIFERTS